MLFLATLDHPIARLNLCFETHILITRAYVWHYLPLSHESTGKLFWAIAGVSRAFASSLFDIQVRGTYSRAAGFFASICSPSLDPKADGDSSSTASIDCQ